ncbi:hypothetical protein AVEN_166229-1 [Araneus ventricosus]|uniref:Uncharacterized protein n=1 Tax=Araneus ventricosus TaxID=182803 RepID=A0A4Y2FQP6_ARAVE|nr:hypothetical protein AVEN_166229-1 [Araneus ventricosus]
MILTPLCHEYLDSVPNPYQYLFKDIMPCPCPKKGNVSDTAFLPLFSSLRKFESRGEITVFRPSEPLHGSAFIRSSCCVDPYPLHRSRS